MRKARGNQPRRVKTRMAAPQPISMNTSDPLPNLPVGDYPILDNVLARQGRIESRPYLEAQGRYDNEAGQVMEDSGYSCEWQHEGESYGIYAEDNQMFYQNLKDDSSAVINYVTDSSGTRIFAANATAVVPTGDRVYVFRKYDPPYVLEWSDANNRLEARLAGFEQTGYTGLNLSTGVLSGEYIYGVELVRKSGDATIASGGIHRTFTSGEVIVWTLDEDSAQITADLHASDTNWTHIRLWRTKRLDVDPDTDVVRGQRNILFLVQEIARASWAGSFAFDNFADDELPVLSLGAQEATDGSFELTRLPPADVAHYSENRLWFGGTDLDEDDGQRVYLSKSQFQYAESYDPLDGEPCQDYDSGYIQGIFTYEGDLIIVRFGETGRIPASDPLNGYYPTDRSRGFAKRRMGSVYGVGIFACSPAGDIYRFGDSRTWEPVIAGSQTRLRGEFQKDTTIRFGQYDGNVLVHENYLDFGEIYILNANDGLGWTRMILKDLEGLTDAQAIWWDPQGRGTTFLVPRANYAHSAWLASGDQEWRRTGMSNKDQFRTEAGGTDYVEIEFGVMFPPFQDNEGRSVYEHTYFSLMASLFVGSFVVTCIGPDRDTVVSQGTAVPANAMADNTDKDLFLDYSMQPDEPVYGTRICYKVTASEPFRITSAQVECMVSSVQARNYRPDLIPTQRAAKDPLRNRTRWVTRGNPTKDVITKQTVKEVT